METVVSPRRNLAQLDGFQLKWIAVVSMVLDHIGSIVMDGALVPYRTGDSILLTGDEPFLIRNAFVIKNILDALGSAAFPIFCFLIAEGFVHTHNRRRYALLLGLFALVSELPYNLAHNGTLLYPNLQNVLFTLFIGVLTLAGIHLIEQRCAARPRMQWLLIALCVAVGGAAAFLIRSEYVFLGILSMSLFYLLRDHGAWRLAGLVPLLVASPFVLLAAPVLYCYDGTRGRGSKYFFYIFYPTHFLVLYGIARLLARG